MSTAEEEDFELAVDGQQLRCASRGWPAAARCSRSTTSPSSRARSACSRGARWRARWRTRSRIRSRRSGSACSTCVARTRTRACDFDRVLDQNVTRILAEIDRLDEIARAFSRYGSAPEERARAEPIDVAAVVRDVVALERMGAGTVPAWEEDGGTRRCALAPRRRAQEVLLNVLENARHAAAKTVRVRVAVARRRRSRGTRRHHRARRRPRHPGDVLPRHLRAALLHAHERERTRAADQPAARRGLGRVDHGGERGGAGHRRRDPSARAYSVSLRGGAALVGSIRTVLTFTNSRSPNSLSSRP